MRPVMSAPQRLAPLLALLAALRATSGERLIRRADTSADNATSRSIGAAASLSAPRVFFLFLAVDKISNLGVWKAFFMQAPQEQYLAFVHCKLPSCNEMVKGSPLTPVATVPSYYCTDLVSPMNQLLSYALQASYGRSHPADKFAFVSDSTLPAKPFSQLYATLGQRRGSDFCVFPSGEWADVPSSGGGLEIAVKHHQWITLERAHAEQALEQWSSKKLHDFMARFRMNLEQYTWSNNSFADGRNFGCLDEFWHMAALYGPLRHRDAASVQQVQLSLFTNAPLQVSPTAGWQGECDTFVIWSKYLHAVGRNPFETFHASLDAVSVPHGGNLARPGWWDTISTVGIAAIRSSPFLFVRKFIDGPRLADGGDFATAYQRIVLGSAEGVVPLPAPKPLPEQYKAAAKWPSLEREPDEIGLAVQVAKLETYSEMVKYSLSSTPRIFVLDGRQQSTEGFGDLQEHTPKSWFTKDYTQADFIVAGSYSRVEMARDLIKLPQHPINRPYIAWTLGLHLPMNCVQTKRCPLFTKLHRRGDFLLLSFDLRGYDLANNTADPQVGVTMSPARGCCGTVRPPQSKPKYFLTFQGTNNLGIDGSSHVRNDLRKHFANFTEREDVIVRVLEIGKAMPSSWNTPTYAQLMNSAYVLVPHGHGRWNYRFSEVLRACAIPVIMADGLTLPFEELINYTDLVYYRPEAMARTPQQLVDSLPTDMDAIQSRRKQLCEIYNAHFSTLEKRSEALWRSALVYVAKRLQKLQQKEP